MTTSTVGQLQTLLAQLQQLDLKEPDAELEGPLAAAIAAAEGHISKRRKNSEARSSLGVGTVEPDQDTPHSRIPTLMPQNTSSGCSTPPQSSQLATASIACAISNDSSGTSRARFPFMSMEIPSPKPSVAAYKNPQEIRQFGMPLAGVIAVEPPLHLFVWPADRLSRAGKPEPDVLIPVSEKSQMTFNVSRHLARRCKVNWFRAACSAYVRFLLLVPNGLAARHKVLESAQLSTTQKRLNAWFRYFIFIHDMVQYVYSINCMHRSGVEVGSCRGTMTDSP
ncbi:hypothetical protein C8R47DRAFT_1126621 [Mycena vitilis]|nr:hypothetical protein C8R47DRAFT_1126621 [Mycena vitilis]